MKIRPAWVGTALLFIALFCSLSFGQEIQVGVGGGVARPGTYAVPGGSRLSSLIQVAGGFHDNAWLAGAVLARKSLAEARKARLRESISRIEAEARQAPGDNGAKRAFFDYLYKPEPRGIIPIRLSHLRLLKGSEQDLTLEEGDRLDIPTGKPPVTVAGAIRGRDRSSFPHSGKTGCKDYIRLAGGFSDDADRDHVYLMKAGGAAAVVLTRKWIEWNQAKSRWEFTALAGNAPIIEPGDTIVVPRKASPGSWSNRVRGLPRLLMEIHVLTGVRIEPP